MMGAVEIGKAFYAEIDKSIDLLNSNKSKWANLAIPTKINMLLEARKKIGLNAVEWVELSVNAKQIGINSPLAGEEWSTGPWAIATTISNYVLTLQAIFENKKSSLLKKVKTRSNGQVVASVFPNNLYERILLNGIHAEIWMQEGISAANLIDSIGVFYKKKNPVGKVSLILGAGNINAIPALDVLHKLLAEGDVVILKMNPINDYLTPVLNKIFQPFIKEGYLRIVSGGAEIGGYLTKHPQIETIHITGSERTHDIIVFGSGEEGKKRKAECKPVLDSSKIMTSELGGIGPMIVIPGPWSQADIDFQAENIVSAKLHNSGHNCVAAQIIVLPKNWDKSQKLIDAITEKLKNVTPRTAYYPGAEKSQKDAVAAYPKAQQFAGNVPCTFITGVDANNSSEYCFSNEFFGPIYAQTFIEGESTSSYLNNAVKFCNEKLSGTLGATILVHPKTKKHLGADFEKALANLNYGSIGVNVWNAVAFLVTQCSWGAFPGHTLNDIQSGIGSVHNTFLFDKPQKSVVYGPFRTFPRAWFNGDFNLMPKPIWFVTNKTSHITSERITKFAVNPGFKHLPGIFIAALKG